MCLQRIAHLYYVHKRFCVLHARRFSFELILRGFYHRIPGKEREIPHHCGSLVQPLVCALFLPPVFCLFKVTKILSRSNLRKYLRGSLPSKVPSGVPFGYFITGGQCLSFQSPSKHPSHQTLHNCHIMCPNFFSELPSFPSTVWGTPWLLYNWWTMSIFPTTSKIPFTPNPSQVPYHVSKNFFSSAVLPKYLLGYPSTTY